MPGLMLILMMMKQKLMAVENNPLFLSLKFKGDGPSHMLSQRLARAVNRTFYAGRLSISFSGWLVFNVRPNDSLPKSSSSSCIHQCNCCCGTSYMGRTISQMSESMCTRRFMGLVRKRRSESGEKYHPTVASRHRASHRC
ncbi:unnamed protein product [Heterobilharzia americana]|nr:unnamed protein product [Heterobilharzia americana]